MRRSILGWLEVPVNESLWFHAMEIGHALGTLKTPAHGMGGSVIGEGFSTMQNCGQENTVTNTTTTDDRPPAAEPSRKPGPVVTILKTLPHNEALPMYRPNSHS